MTRLAEGAWTEPLTWLSLASLLFFLPMLAVGSYDRLTGSVYEGFIQSIEFTYIVICTLALSLPLVIDLVFDLFSYRNTQFLGFRVMSISSILIAGVVSLATQYTPYGATATQAFVTWSYFIDIAVMLCLLRYFLPHVFTLPAVIIGSILFFAAVITFNLNSIPACSGPSLAVTFYCLLYVFAALFLGLSVSWTLEMRKSFIASNLSLASWRRGLTSNEQCAIVLICCAGLSILAITLFFFAFGSDTVFLDRAARGPVLMAELGRSVLAVFTYLLPSRIFRAGAVAREADLNTKTEFVKYISHEMRSPVGALLMGLSSLESHLQNIVQAGDPVSAEYVLAEVRHMKDAGLGALAILDDLLLYEKIERGNLVFNFESVQPLLEMHKLLDVWHKDIEFIGNMEEEQLRGYRIKIDRNRIKLVFNALLGKAVKRALLLEHGSDAGKLRVEFDLLQQLPAFIRKNSGSVSPRVVPEGPSSRAFRISIIDCCAPFTADEIALYTNGKMNFDRRSNDESAFGFGLWIAKNIIDQHGALLTVHQETVETLVYRIDFPLYEKDPDDDQTQRSVRLRHPKRASISNSIDQRTAMLQILVVDDSAMVRRVTSKLVSDLGHTSAEAVDGQQAVLLIKEGRKFDVILMDNQMPVMTGVEATRIIRTKLNYKGKIIGVTGNALDEDVQLFMASGADQIVLKPLSREALSKICKGVRRRRSQLAS